MAAFLGLSEIKAKPRVVFLNSVPTVARSFFGSLWLAIKLIKDGSVIGILKVSNLPVPEIILLFLIGLIFAF